MCTNQSYICGCQVHSPCVQGARQVSKAKCARDHARQPAAMHAGLQDMQGQIPPSH
jgi:hypothetical protein